MGPKTLTNSNRLPSQTSTQSLVELINNLALEPHSDAWLDLSSEVANERQRIAGQLVQSLESAAVLLASTLGGAAGGDSAQQAEAFVKTSESAYVSVRTLNPRRQQQQQQQQSREVPQEGAGNRSIEVSFPTETSLFGTKWMGSQPQKFTLHLQTSMLAAAAATAEPAADQSGKFSRTLISLPPNRKMPPPATRHFPVAREEKTHNGHHFAT